MTPEKLQGQCPFVDEGGFPCGRPLEDAGTNKDKVGVWACELGHTVEERVGTDTEGLYGEQS